MNMKTVRTALPPSCMARTAGQGSKGMRCPHWVLTVASLTESIALDTHSKVQRRKAFTNGKPSGDRFSASAGETARPRRAPGNGPGGKIEEEVPRYRVAHEDDTPSSGFSNVSTQDHDLSFVGAWDS